MMPENKQKEELQLSTHSSLGFFPFSFSSGGLRVIVYAPVMSIWKEFIYTGCQKCWWSLAGAVLCNFRGAAQFSRSSCSG